MTFDLKKFEEENPGILPADVAEAIRNLPKAAQPDEAPPAQAEPSQEPDPSVATGEPQAPTGPDPVFEFYGAVQQLDLTGQAFHMLSKAMGSQVPVSDGSYALNRIAVKQCLDMVIATMGAVGPALSVVKKAIE